MLYHITDKPTAAKILKEGLKPMIGLNSKLVDETEPAIYLCRRKDIHYWQILLQKFVILGINENAIKLDNNSNFKYTLYEEFIIKHEIPPHAIKRVYMSNNRTKQNYDLCIYYLRNLSRYCEVCARWYDTPNPDKDWFDEIKLDSKLLTKLLPNLDYSVISKTDIKSNLKEMGENGMYTLCDTFYNENKRLYQKLIEYPNDELTKYRQQIHNYITTNLKGCLNVNTGGWCGC